MTFNTDKQTLEDLNILGKPGGDSVFALYNNTHTRGGADILEQLFLYPLGDVESINQRSRSIQYFSTLNLAFPISTVALDSAELYLSMTDKRTMLSQSDDTLARKFSQLIAVDGDQKLIINGIIAVIGILQRLQEFVSKIKATAKVSAYQGDLAEIQTLLAATPFKSLLEERQPERLPYSKLVDLDQLLRFGHRSGIQQMLRYVYQLDVLMSVAATATKKQYLFPKALPKAAQLLKLKNVRHPLVKNARGNSLEISPGQNIVFLTGANMAGKSTFMKSLGIALYLAHMGFPVAAEEMEFSVRDGIYTTINLPDDLSSGNSHFYAEVLRVKKIAKELGAGKSLFVIFDELFRGTNVKDAYEGTIAITEAFAQKRNCMFVVSTHIIEAGSVLKKRCANINFVYLPTRMEGNTPVYTYQLEEGITADRHGMVIINNERILEIIRSRKHKTPES